jgi:hypothetical protein
MMQPQSKKGHLLRVTPRIAFFTIHKDRYSTNKLLLKNQMRSVFKKNETVCVSQQNLVSAACICRKLQDIGAYDWT